MKTNIVKVGIKNPITIGRNAPVVLIAGPCVIENPDLVRYIAEKIKIITNRIDMPFIFKASYTKANRMSLHSYSGPGQEKRLKILKEIKYEIERPIVSDVHTAIEIPLAAEVLDILQIPAFLSRQTDLIVTAAKTNKPLNIKKGQFLAPEDMKQIAEKSVLSGNEQICLTERGAMFGYHNWVVDYRSLVIMRNLGYPIIFDATHSVQQPAGKGNVSGGNPEFIYPLARASVAVGIDAIFIETHSNPDEALCDGANMLHLDKLEELLKQLQELDNIRNRHE